MIVKKEIEKQIWRPKQTQPIQAQVPKYGTQKDVDPVSNTIDFCIARQTNNRVGSPTAIIHLMYLTIFRMRR